MSLAERGLYVECLVVQWRLGYVPNDLRLLARAIGCDAREIRRSWDAVRARFEPLDDTKLINRRLEDDRKLKDKKSQLASESANRRWERICEDDARASTSCSVSESLSQTQKNSEVPTRARETSQVVWKPPSKPMPDTTSFHAFWERYRKLRDAGRMQLAAQMWISYDCEEHAGEIEECLASYEASRDRANGAIQNADTWLRNVFDSKFTARWPPPVKNGNSLQDWVNSDD